MTTRTAINNGSHAHWQVVPARDQTRGTHAGIHGVRQRRLAEGQEAEPASYWDKEADFRSRQQSYWAAVCKVRRNWTRRHRHTLGISGRPSTRAPHHPMTAVQVVENACCLATVAVACSAAGTVAAAPDGDAAQPASEVWEHRDCRHCHFQHAAYGHHMLPAHDNNNVININFIIAALFTNKMQVYQPKNWLASLLS